MFRQCQAIEARISDAGFFREFESVSKKREAAEFVTARRSDNENKNRYGCERGRRAPDTVLESGGTETANGRGWPPPLGLSRSDSGSGGCVAVDAQSVLLR